VRGVSTTVGRLLDRAKECQADVGEGGFAGFMSGVQHGLEIARRDPARARALAVDLRIELRSAGTADDVEEARADTDRAIDAILAPAGRIQ
jgi:hypothetical protein